MWIEKRGGGKLQTSDWSMAAGVRSSTMLVVTAMAVTSSSGVLAVMLARTAAVCAVSETSCYMDGGRGMDTHDDGVLYVVWRIYLAGFTEPQCSDTEATPTEIHWQPLGCAITPHTPTHHHPP